MTWSLVLTAAVAAPPAAAPEFERDVLPLLTNQCLNCHGGLRQKNGLDLRTVEAMTKGGKSGPAVVAGKPDDSLLWKKVASDQMPDALLKLNPAEKKLLRDWIAAGLPRTPNWNRVPVEKPAAASDPKQVASAIDKAVDARLAAANLTPADPADDAEFLRRASLDLTGRPPTPDRVGAFLASADPAKRAKAVEDLLAAPEYADHFARVWHHRIVPPADGVRGYNPTVLAWLGKAFAENRRWDAVATDFVTATGDSSASPAVAALAVLKDPDKIGSRVGSLFLGVSLECAECHDHPHARWRQKDDYWALAAFFGQVKIAGAKKNGETVVTVTEPAANPAKPPAIKIPSTALIAAGVSVPLGFPGAEKPAAVAAPYRPALAAWLTDPANPYFAPAAANRWWAHFFGRGLVNPVDDMHDGNAATHPEVLALLAAEFRASGYDVRHLVRSIVLTKAYQRTSRAEKEHTELEALYGRVPVRQLTPDVLYDALCQALDVPDLRVPLPDPREKDKDKKTGKGGSSPRELFVNTFKFDAESPREYDHGVLQILQLANWKDFNTGGEVAKRLADGKVPAEAAVEELYLRTVSRPPTAAERGKVLAHLARRADARAGYADVLWVLINGSEFAFNH